MPELWKRVNRTKTEWKQGDIHSLWMPMSVSWDNQVQCQKGLLESLDYVNPNTILTCEKKKLWQEININHKIRTWLDMPNDSRNITNMYLPEETVVVFSHSTGSCRQVLSQHLLCLVKVVPLWHTLTSPSQVMCWSCDFFVYFLLELLTVTLELITVFGWTQPSFKIALSLICVCMISAFFG